MHRNRFLAAAAALLGVAALVPIATVLGDDAGPGSRIESATALGTTFTYQGRLTDGGSPANGTYDLRFILYDAESGGAQVGTTVTKDDVAVQNGLFSVELDFGANAFRGDARWMEIAVRPGSSTGAYTVLSPRQPVSPAPYALYAATAGNLAVPLAVSGNTAGVPATPEGLITVNQAGTGIAIAANRTTTDSAQFPAIVGVNHGGGAGIQGESIATGGIGVRGFATGGTAGAFIGPVALDLDGALKVSGGAPFAFQHTVVLSGANKTTCAATGNAVSYITAPQVMNKSNLLVFVTPADVSAGSLTSTVGVLYQSTAPAGCPDLLGAWALYTADGSNFASGQTFNILVITK